MYTTVREYVERTNVPLPFAVRTLSELRETGNPNDILDYVLTPDLEYLVDVLSMARRIVDHLEDVFDDLNAELISRWTTNAEYDVHLVTVAHGHEPTEAARKRAFLACQDLAAVLLQERFVDEMVWTRALEKTICDAFEAVFDARIEPGDELYRVALRHLTIRKNQDQDMVLAAFRRWRLTPEGRRIRAALKQKNEKGSEST